VKVLGGETNLNAPISVGSASVVRVFNSDSSNLLVTRKTSGGTTVGTFMVPAGKVVYCEKDYTDTLEGGTNLKVTQVAFSPMMSFVSQAGDPVPTYTHSVSATAVSEGGNFTTTITTTNVDDGTNLYWELTGVQSADFSSGALTGTVSISNNSATFSHTVDEDNTTEGTETATIKVYSDSGRTTQVGNTLTVTISDDSTTPPAASTEFDGDNDFLYVGGNGARVACADFGTGAYTIEFWIKTNRSSQWLVFNAHNDSGVRIALGNNASTGHVGQIEINEQVNNDDQYTRSATRVDDNYWHHCAFSRPDGGRVKVFVDGKLEAEGAGVGRNLTGVDNLFIGRRSSGGPYFSGKMFGLRIAKDCLYTEDFNVTDELLTATSQGASNTTLLCCQQTDVNAAEVSPEASNTLQVFGATSSSDDPLDEYSHEFFGGEYLSMDLDNTNKSDFHLSAVDFTFECWYYPHSNPSWVGLMSQWPNNGYSVANSWTFEPVGNLLQFYYCNTAGNYYSATAPGTLQTNQWQHCAVTRNGNTINVWLNGAKGSDHTIVGTMQDVDTDVAIGGNVAGSGYADGLISNLRLTKGQALYTSNFTPSSSQVTTTSQGATASNVKFLGLHKGHWSMVKTDPILDKGSGSGDVRARDADPFN